MAYEKYVQHATKQLLLRMLAASVAAKQPNEARQRNEHAGLAMGTWEDDENARIQQIQMAGKHTAIWLWFGMIQPTKLKKFIMPSCHQSTASTQPMRIRCPLVSSTKVLLRCERKRTVSFRSLVTSRQHPSRMSEIGAVLHARDEPMVHAGSSFSERAAAAAVQQQQCPKTNKIKQLRPY